MANEPEIFLVGNVGGDPELKFLPSGQAVCNMSVAVTPARKDRDSGEWHDGETMWFRIVSWGRDAEAVAENVTKGQRVAVKGTLAIKSYEKNDGTTGISNEVTGRVLSVLKNAGPPADSGGDDPWKK